MRELFLRHGPLLFCGLTFAISLVAGLLAFRIGGSKTFSSPQALPFLLLAIWSPNLAALVCAGFEGRLAELLSSLRAGASLHIWLVALLPMLIALVVAAREPTSQSLAASSWLALIFLNLIMGPLGEELGWRGYLLPRWIPVLGSVGAAIAVGLVWALWHLPLWFLPSPHSTMSFPLFAATVLCFSIIITGLWMGGASLWPAVLFHLAANVGVGWVESTTSMTSNDIYRASVPFYVIAAVITALWLGRQTRGLCDIV